MVAYRELDKSFFQTWSKKHREASKASENRERKLTHVYEEAERDLMVSVKELEPRWGRGGGGRSETKQGSKSDLDQHIKLSLGER